MSSASVKLEGAIVDAGPVPSELDELEVRFTYHAPSESQIPKYNHIRHQAHQLAIVFVGLVPPSRERSLALTKLEEAVMWANAGIARR